MPATHLPSRFRLRARTLVLGALALLVGLSCKEVTGPEDSAVDLAIIAGDNQAGRVASDLDDPIVVRVTNRSGGGVKGATVLFTPDSGSGSTNPLVATTDSTGVASVRWRLGTALGAMRLTASFADLTPVTITATAVPDRIEVVSGDLQSTRVTGTLSQPLVVKVTDFVGREVQGVSVSFTPDSGSGTVAPALIATDAQGLARTTWTLGASAGAKRVVVAIATGSPVEFSAVANQDVLNLASGGNQGSRAGTTLPRPVQVRVTDQTGAPVRNVIVNFEPATGSGSVSPASAQSNDQGFAQTNWTLGATAGVQTLTARSTFATPITVTASALQPSDVVAVSGDQQITRVGALLPTDLVVLVTDATGRAVPGAQVSFVPDSGNGTATPAVATTDTLGQARTSWTLGGGIGIKRLRAVSGTDTLTFQATATADLLTVTGGANQTARFGTALPVPVAVTARDLSGVVVPGVVITFTPDAGSGTVAPATVTTDATGVARTLWTLGGAPGSMRLVASAATAATSVEVLATATADTSRVIAAQAGNSQVALTRASLGTALVARVTDRFGNPVPGQVVNWSGTGLALSSTSSTTNASGDASVTVTTTAEVGAMSVRATMTGRSEVATFGVSTRANLTSVFAGDFHNCALDETGTAYCWGFNQQGQLGAAALTDDMTNAMRTPVTSGSQVPRFRKISTQGIDACGVTVESQLICWGAGTGNFGKSTPTRVTFTSFTNLKDVAVGSNFACALDVGGVAWCHGINGYGQLGSDSTADNTTGPYYVVTQPLSSIDAGLVHACGFQLGGTALYCWGYNFNGAVGDGTNTSRRAATLVSGGITWDTTSLAVGGSHTCALNSAGAAYCWGSNAYGQLGDGTTTARNVPTLVSGGLTFTRLSAGRDFTCGITAANVAHCWGRNNAGQLGDGTRVNRSAPTAVGGGLTFRSLSLGELHSCGVIDAANGSNNTLATPGTVHCWGDGEKGQLGNGAFRANNDPALAPTRVSHQP